MQSSVEALLADLAASATSERDKGDKFERLIRRFLAVDAGWAARFSEVFLWRDWPGRGDRPDRGIDLVAIERETGAPTAVQCKFYARDYYLTKPDIDSFLSESGKHPFAGRLIVSTTDRWNSAAEAAIWNQQIPVQRIGLTDLIDSSIDWAEFDFGAPDRLAVKPKKTLRPHQQTALDHVVAGFADHDRGKLIMACGTGKTFASLKIAEAVAGAGGTVLFLVPSIALLSQSLREWSVEAEVPLRAFAVCSDAKVGQDKGGEGEDISVVDLDIPATTDPARLIARVRGQGHAGAAGPGTSRWVAPGAGGPAGSAGGSETGEPSGRMTVVFSTYQSIDVIHQAQAQGLGRFDLIICDEAHRTTGATLTGQDESAFVRVHDDAYIAGAKRLYMTATPRIYDDASKAKAGEADALLASMDDEALYGPEFHRLDFGEAVGLGLLSDYRVLILTVPENAVSRVMQSAFAVNQELNLPDAAKIIGCWNGLSKRGDPAHDFPSDPAPMKRAVAFCQSIKTSQVFAAEFDNVVDHYTEYLSEDSVTIAADGAVETAEADLLDPEVHHVDGTMNILTRNAALDWLRSEPAEGHCRILTNARCLAEGVDVPALDAVLFLNPRKSEVDVVQAVGRVMRQAPGKKYGYIILPIGIPAGQKPDLALRNNERYSVIWKVLQALRAHDSRFNAMINQIELNTTGPDQIRIIGVDVPGGEPTDQDHAGAGSSGTGAPDLQDLLPADWGEWRDAIFAKIVDKVGSRRYWEDWAKDVADIVAAHKARLTDLIEAGDWRVRAAFTTFLAGLKGNLNDSIDAALAIDMLSQHMITKPVFDALFDDYQFSAHNPVAQVMQTMLEALEGSNLEAETTALDKFYASVRERVQGIDNAQGKQRVLMELYEKFFRLAFKKTAESLGIVYTPVEIVDFILRSVDYLLHEHFGQGLTDQGVHLLDPFTGTGTFIVRLLESGLIRPEDLARKYAEELHANEILLLAYYIAAANIEVTYHTVMGATREAAAVGGSWESAAVGPGNPFARNQSAGASADGRPGPSTLPNGFPDPTAFGVGDPSYVPFPGIVLADTFQMTEAGDTLDETVFVANNDRAAAQLKLPIRVIVGNPPYSVGQSSGNDDNANLKYPTLDARIEATYAARSSATNKNSLYDSYIRAIRWASDRLGDRGVVAYVSNGGYIDGNTADGLRQTLVDEFAHVYVYNLRGNQRTAGELSRREGGKIFGSGSRNTVAVLILVKQPGSADATLHYHDIGDYLSRDEKLAIVAASGVDSIAWETIQPNQAGDWINQRTDVFTSYPSVGDRGAPGLFAFHTSGLKTNRDAWVYGFSQPTLRQRVAGMVEFYNVQMRRVMEIMASDLSLTAGPVIAAVVDRDPAKFSWNRADNRNLTSTLYTFDPERVYTGAYRPFCPQHVVYDRQLNDMVYRLGEAFPTPAHANVGIELTGVSSHYDFTVIATDRLPDLHLLDTGQFYPRWRYEPITDDSEQEMLSFDDPGADTVIVNGHADAGRAQGELARPTEAKEGVGGRSEEYRRVDNITDAALADYRKAYGPQVSKDDIFWYVYGLLHSPDYRREFAADLKKMLPRIPLVDTRETFETFVVAGRELMDLHVHYEQADPWPDLVITGDEPEGDPYAWYRVTKMTYGKARVDGKQVADKTTVIYNPHITITGIPLEAQAYLLGARSALDWILERYQIKTDKPSGIVNDPNDWSREHHHARYILDLLTKVVTVSLRTVEIVNALPRVEFTAGGATLRPETNHDVW